MTKAISVFDAILSRKSMRAFTKQAVDMDIIKQILNLAKRAPSGANIQPWQVIVLTKEALENLGDYLYDLSINGTQTKRAYHYYPLKWFEPYLARRRKVGYDLYASLGILKGDKEKMARQHAKNFKFFHAPVGLIFTIDKDLEMGSWLDYGMFIQTIALAARGFGLDSCIQAAFSDFHVEIRQKLQIAENQNIICGMAIGYADKNAVENNFSTERAPLDDFVRFVDKI